VEIEEKEEEEEEVEVVVVIETETEEQIETVIEEVEEEVLLDVVSIVEKMATGLEIVLMNLEEIDASTVEKLDTWLVNVKKREEEHVLIPIVALAILVLDHDPVHVLQEDQGLLDLLLTDVLVQDPSLPQIRKRGHHLHVMVPPLKSEEDLAHQMVASVLLLLLARDHPLHQQVRDHLLLDLLLLQDHLERKTIQLNSLTIQPHQHHQQMSNSNNQTRRKKSMNSMNRTTQVLVCFFFIHDRKSQENFRNQ